jgi:uncharacterized phage protein (TIGR01671 family)
MIGNLKNSTNKKKKNMKREFKFRMWCKEINAMYDCLTLTPFAVNSTMQEKNGVYIPFDDDIVIQQYTGLKDKNGKEIYEGDIVKAKTWYPEEDGLVHPTSIFDYMGVVKFGYGGFYICEEQTHESLCFYYESDEFQVFPNSEIELIGNIMENPELLK